MTHIRRLNRSLYALAVLGALTFGAAQAFATSGQPGTDRGRPYCDPDECNVRCGGYGICYGTYGCLCY
jgi:hypothetical protein